MDLILLAGAKILPLRAAGGLLNYMHAHNPFKWR
jgi:hypothetical protein